MNTELDELTARLARTEARLEQSETRLAAAESRMIRATCRARMGGSFACVALVVATLILSRPAAMAQAGITLSSLLARVVALETKTAALTQTGTPGTAAAKLTITGDNVQIVDGSGYTDDGTNGETSSTKLKGLGNLIIGYNHTGNIYYGDVRTGSHNLILGDFNNYSSYGGMIAGEYNLSSAPYASVSGGEYNMATAEFASVTGGVFNEANNYYASVNGGETNTADSAVSTVSGGFGIYQDNLYGWSGGSYHTP